MAPPMNPFPVSELDSHIPVKSKNFKETSRKLPRDFDLSDCELLKIVQYTCTTQQIQKEHMHQNPGADPLPHHCYPFTRLYRKCYEGGIGGKHRTFHVETTAWEGQHQWVPNSKKVDGQVKIGGEIVKEDVFAKYGSYFWNSK